MLNCPLSPRQIEILGWRAQGKTSLETGMIVGCARRTVESHLERARLLTGASSVTALVALAIRKGWMD